MDRSYVIFSADVEFSAFLDFGAVQTKKTRLENARTMTNDYFPAGDQNSWAFAPFKCVNPSGSNLTMHGKGRAATNLQRITHSREKQKSIGIRNKDVIFLVAMTDQM